MQEKTIKSVLRKKIDDWCNHIDDEDVNDFDVYFKTYDTTKLVAEYFYQVICLLEERIKDGKEIDDT